MGNLVMSSCGFATVKKSRIHGTMESAQWDGKKIYLVPMFGHVDAAHVDSTIIKNGRFEFATDSCEMKRITSKLLPDTVLKTCWWLLSLGIYKCL